MERVTPHNQFTRNVFFVMYYYGKQQFAQCWLERKLAEDLRKFTKDIVYYLSYCDRVLNNSIFVSQINSYAISLK